MPALMTLWAQTHLLGVLAVALGSSLGDVPCPKRCLG